MSSKRVLTALLVLLLCLAGPRAWAYDDLYTPEQIETNEVNYRTANVELGSLVRMANSGGQLYHPIAWEVKYEYSGAKFVEYKVKSGSVVQKGDVLAELKVESSAAEIERAELDVVRTEEELARGIRDREESIKEAKKTLNQSTSYAWELQNIEVQRQELDLERYKLQMEHQIEQKRKDLEETKDRNSSYLLAPKDGVISSCVSKALNDDVYAGEVLVYMASEEKTFILVDNVDQDFRYNMPITYKNSAGASGTGRVVAADDAIEDLNYGFALVELDLPEGETVSYTGITVYGESLRLDNVYMVPQQAVHLEEIKRYVNKLVDGNVVKRYVNVGMVLSNMWVLQGVSEGDVLVIGG